MTERPGSLDLSSTATSSGLPVPVEHLSLFSHPGFHEVTLAPGLERLQVDQWADGRLIGSLVGVVADGEFISGFSAPFGGIDLVRETESLPRMLELVDSVCGQLDDKGVATIRIRARPPIYSSADTALQFASLDRGFRIESVEFNQHLDLTGLTSLEDYVARLGWRGRRDFRRAAAQPLTFREDTDDSDRAAAYDVLKVNRERKGRPLRLSLDYLERLRESLPGRVRWFSTLAGGRTCASAVIYVIRPGRWLLVYWGDARHELPQSPMNFLAAQLVARALAEKVVLIDLGISSDGGRLNPGLAQFKDSVGAESTLRLELVRRTSR